ncbi:uncharacterized protein Z520_02667 [Fonsecaea multimorphosa CBS 102226]|uniref:aldehyde dehydrogenase (NAD(+)) n=1 Tax=Fonsecaea multimorphosa CBS 102226 TaxID=1442371 RepID=A0A0D2KD31_9EURO|nr:uncharacterized protein Z520_02667 [Fonsecaea multimorphosa CBS 102226]KIY01115.1 hypothetical protein Z520_02667 [Fonsecaea multimorphosa CBS 102226]OAL28736.1 hypothetical protein AYO22_02601 [Fonsecaea multimorphosa]
MASKYEGRLFIGGSLVSGMSGRTFPLKNPATNETIAEITVAEQQDVDKAVEAAAKAQPVWAATPAYQRGRILRKFADLVYQNREKIQKLDSLAMGKPLSSAKGELEEACNITNYFAGLVELADGQTSTNNNEHLNLTIRQPFGVVAAIIPWNFPALLFCHEIVPACGAGNAMILKTSEKAPLSGVFLGQLCHEAGIPPGVVNVISGAGETGALLSSHMQIRRISFTGSTRAGRAVMEAAAKSNIKDVALELGGKSPLIVFADASLDRAVECAVHSFTSNAGQTCTASTRLYVERTVASEFKQMMVDRIKKLNQGPPSATATDVGPQADSAQTAAIARFLEMGKAEGQILVGGKLASEIGDNFVQPTVVTGVGDDSEINREEVFGPVLVLHEFDNEDDVIRRANDSDYGLYASLFTTKINRALRVAKALEAGSVGVNVSSPYGAYELPFGGFKASGIGRQKGSDAVKAWTQEKTVYIHHG